MEPSRILRELKEKDIILKYVITAVIFIICFSLLRTQGSSVGDGEDQEGFPGELTLHPDPLTPEGLPCTPANAVEVHRDSQPGEENLLLGMHKISAGKMWKESICISHKSSEFYLCTVASKDFVVCTG